MTQTGLPVCCSLYSLAKMTFSITFFIYPKFFTELTNVRCVAVKRPARRRNNVLRRPPPPPVRIPPIKTGDITVAAAAARRRAQFRRQVEERLRRQGLTVTRRNSPSAFKHRDGRILVTGTLIRAHAHPYKPLFRRGGTSNKRNSNLQEIAKSGVPQHQEAR